MVKNTALKPTFSINCKGRLLDLSSPAVMGIINVTADSFYAGSRHRDAGSILEKAGQMLGEGAAMIDVGGQSSRPKARLIGLEEESDQVIPAIEAIAARFPRAIISVDTFYAEVARRAVAAGAVIINDISAGNMDGDMIVTAGALGVPYIAMHMQGTPATMQDHPVYENVTREILDFFIFKIEECRHAGINDVIVDPGFCFGKNLAHNYTLLRELSVFTVLDRPVMAGVSRKSMIWRPLGIAPDGALNGTTVLHVLALQNGANILRVHDVRPAVEAVKLWELYQGRS